MPDLVERMVRATGTGQSWHGKETTLDPQATMEQWLEQAGLAWTVYPMPILVQGRRENRAAPDYKALVHGDTGAILDVVSKDFHVHQNRDLVSIFQSFCDTGDLTLDTMGCLMDGRKIFANARVNGDIYIQTPNGPDTHQLYFLLSTGHYAGFCTQADLTSTRTVCNNTLTIARDAATTSDTRWRLTHLGAWNSTRAAEVKSLLERALGRIPTFKSEWESLYSTPCDRLVESLFYTEQFQPDIYAAVVAKAYSRTLKVGQFTVNLPASTEDGTTTSRTQARLVTLDCLVNDYDARKEIVQTLLTPAKFSRTTARLLETSTRQPGARLSVNTLAHPVNAVTFWTDHERGNGGDGAVDSAMFGQGRRDKANTMNLALDYAQAISTITSGGGR